MTTGSVRRAGWRRPLAAGQARQRCWCYDWIIDLDIKGFFDNIPQDLLLRAVKKHPAISDKAVKVILAEVVGHDASLRQVSVKFEPQPSLAPVLGD